MPKFITHQPIGGFDLTAIGIVLVVVLAIIGARWISRIVSGKPKFDYPPEIESEPKQNFENMQ